MTTLREAAQQALEALELYLEETNSNMQRKAITALRAALAQPDTHPQCAQGCEFLAMDQRRNERETTLKERGFE